MEFRPYKLGKYLLLERLATGGMAEVYRAKASGAGGFEKQLAIKRILPNYSSNEEFRRMFEYEARLSSQLSHANIVQIYDFVKMGETYLLAMEYVNGKNLRQFVNKVRKSSLILPIEFGVYIINEVAKGLDYAHKRRDDLTGNLLYIIHRDMSPQNVMVSYDGAVKIVDFGIAKAKDRVDETRSGVIKGKFGYMSPEQANGEPIDHRSDIFSTSIILFELLTGKRLFTAENDLATLKMIQECKIPIPSRVNPKISADLEKIILKALSKDPRGRYQDGSLLHRHLQEFLYKHYPTFSQKEFADYVQQTFSDDIDQEKKRYEQLHRQSIPFSQGGTMEQVPPSESLDDLVEGNLTASGSEMTTAVTMDESIEDRVVANEKDSSQKSLGSETNNQNKGRHFSPEMLEESVDSNLGKTQVESVFPEVDPLVALSPKKFIPTLLTSDSAPSESTVAQGSESDEHPSLSESRTMAADLKAEESPVSEVENRMAIGTHSLSKESVFASLRPDEKGVEKTFEPPTPLAAAPETNEVPVLETEKHSESNIEPSSFREENRQKDRPINALSESDSATWNTPPAVVTNEKILDEKPKRDWSAIELSELRHTNKKIKRRSYSKPSREFNFDFRRMGSLLSFAFFLSLLSGTVYLYHFYLNGNLPNFVREYVQNQPTEKKKSLVPPRESAAATPTKEKTETKTLEDCVVWVDSDPPGAKITVGQKEVGVTGLSFTVPCNQTMDLVLKREGFEPIVEKINPREKNSKIFKTLSRIQSGTLELLLDRNANVYLEGRLVKEAVAGEPFEISLRAREKQTVRFVNKIFNIDTTRNYVVQEGTRKLDQVHLEELPRSGKKSKRRRPTSEEE